MAITGVISATISVQDSESTDTTDYDHLTSVLHATPNTITSITEKEKRSEVITTTARTMLIFAATVGAGQFTSWKGVLFFNRSSTETIVLGMIDTGNSAHYVNIPPGRFYCLNDSKMQNNATGGAYVAPMVDIDSITAQTVANTAKLEWIFVG